MGFFDLHEPEDGQDRFFLYAMIILPFCSSGSYLFDSWYHYHSKSKVRTYEGLLSTIVIVFSFLKYCAPIRSRKVLAVYYILLFLINELASIGYLLYYIDEKDRMKILFYISFLIIELLFTVGLIYCRVINEFECHIAVENKHLFHFMSRLEVILTIYIPVYMKIQYTSLTRNMIAYFLLFDFFSDSYSRFQGIWIKSSLYLFAATTTVSVASEWFYVNHPTHIYEDISLASEVLATILCDIIIILQFFPFHFKTQFIQNIARQAMIFQQNVHASNARTSIAISRALDEIVVEKNQSAEDETIDNESGDATSKN